MSVTAIIGGWASWNKLRGNDDDDWVDRLNHIYTVYILILFGIFIASGQYAGDPIQCWCPAHFTGSYVSYTKSYCWIKNTYYLPMHETISQDNDSHREQEITYYQWIPLILLFMAFMFKFPHFIWRMLAGFSGINLNKVVEMTATTQLVDRKKREQIIEQIAMYLDRWLESNRQYHWNVMVRMKQRASKFCFMCNKREGTFLTGLYLFIKVLFVVNIVCQFFIVNEFLGGFFQMWGPEAANSLWEETITKESRRFPRVTLCDFQIRQLQNIQDYTVQCVLPINLFNEKIFVFLWFWFVLVAVVTCISLLIWFWRVVFRRNRVVIVKKYLKISDVLNTAEDKKLCKRFADQYLRDDGIFLLRIVEKNSNDILLTDLVNKMWEIYINKPMIKKELDGEKNGGDTYA